jgi:hypothetical protein
MNEECRLLGCGAVYILFEPTFRFKQDVNGATSQKTSFFTVTAVKTSNLTKYERHFVVISCIMNCIRMVCLELSGYLRFEVPLLHGRYAQTYGRYAYVLYILHVYEVFRSHDAWFCLNL